MQCKICGKESDGSVCRVCMGLDAAPEDSTEFRPMPRIICPRCGKQHGGNMVGNSSTKICKECISAGQRAGGSGIRKSVAAKRKAERSESLEGNEVPASQVQASPANGILPEALHGVLRLWAADEQETEEQLLKRIVGEAIPDEYFKRYILEG